MGGRRPKRRKLPLLGPPKDDGQSNRLDQPLTAAQLEAAARKQHDLPRRAQAAARAEHRRRKEASARDMARRKALLPYLEGIRYTDHELGRARRLVDAPPPPDDAFQRDAALDERDKRTRVETARQRTAESRGRLTPGGLCDLPGAEDKASALEVADELDARAGGASTRQRMDLLAEPDDAELLREYSARLLRRVARREAEAERIRVGSAPAKGAASDSTGRFPRFADRTRLAVPEAEPRDRGSAWFLATLARAYDAIWEANGKAGRLPPDEEGDDESALAAPKPRSPPVPDVVADMFWRRQGALAPATAREFVRELEKAERAGCRDAALFAGFLTEVRAEDPLLAMAHARRIAEGLFSLDFKQPRQPLRDGADGRVGQAGLLPQADRCPALAPHPLYTSSELRDLKSTLYDPHAVALLLPRNAVLELLRELCGQEAGAARAREDEIRSRGMSAKAAHERRKRQAKQAASRGSRATTPGSSRRPSLSEAGSDAPTEDPLEQLQLPPEAVEAATTPGRMAENVLSKLEACVLKASDGKERLFRPAPPGSALAFPAVEGTLDRDFCDASLFFEAIADFVENSLPEDVVAYSRGADLPLTNRGDAARRRRSAETSRGAAATRTFRGDESRRRRGRTLDRPRRRDAVVAGTSSTTTTANAWRWSGLSRPPWTTPPQLRICETSYGKPNATRRRPRSTS